MLCNPDQSTPGKMQTYRCAAHPPSGTKKPTWYGHPPPLPFLLYLLDLRLPAKTTKHLPCSPTYPIPDLEAAREHGKERYLPLADNPPPCEVRRHLKETTKKWKPRNLLYPPPPT